MVSSKSCFIIRTFYMFLPRPGNITFQVWYKIFFAHLDKSLVHSTFFHITKNPHLSHSCWHSMLNHLKGPENPEVYFLIGPFPQCLSMFSIQVVIIASAVEDKFVIETQKEAIFLLCNQIVLKVFKFETKCTLFTG